MRALEFALRFPDNRAASCKPGLDARMNLEFLESLRSAELDIVLAEVAAGDRDSFDILEIGAGSGWQARRIAARGHRVEAIDLADSPYAATRVWPVVDYDGDRIPFGDAHFDVVFSSNVLEHIPHVKAFQREIRRVLKPHGVAVHVLPSAAWRFWTNLSHYLFVAKMALGLGLRKLALQPSAGPGEANELDHRLRQKSRTEIICKTLLPHRHGELGNALTEIYFFSRWRWTPFFRATGWVVRKRLSNRLFYTGYGVLGSARRYRWSGGGA